MKKQLFIIWPCHKNAIHLSKKAYRTLIFKVKANVWLGLSPSLLLISDMLEHWDPDLDFTVRHSVSSFPIKIIATRARKLSPWMLEITLYFWNTSFLAIHAQINMKLSYIDTDYGISWTTTWEPVIYPNCKYEPGKHRYLGLPQWWCNGLWYAPGTVMQRWRVRF